MLDLINRYSQFRYPVEIDLSWADAMISADCLIANCKSSCATCAGSIINTTSILA